LKDSMMTIVSFLYQARYSRIYSPLNKTKNRQLYASLILRMKIIISEFFV
jgi:hypothetical protein